MQIKIKTTGSVTLNEELTTLIEKKVSKLEVFVKGDDSALAQVEVGTTTEGQKSGDVFRGEIHLTFAGGDLYADAVNETLRNAIDETVKEMRRELKKTREKKRDLARRGGKQIKDFFRNFGRKG
ncbi:MAG: HPF/RaiA family ribosome-associated protein [Patescibacteria group bacterium UBA2163]